MTPYDETPEKKTVEEWAKVHKTKNDWLFKATKVANHWPIGCELTEEQYLEACEATGNAKVSIR